MASIEYFLWQHRGSWESTVAPANGNAADCSTNPDPNISSCFQYGMIAGRDVDLAGGAGSACAADPTLPECNVCRNWIDDPTANCEEPSGGFASPFGYEGLFAAHEQVNLSGSSNFAGLVIAEEAAYCVEPQPQERRLE